MIKAIIYDLDGTIISSEALHKEAWLKTASKFGLKPEELDFDFQSGRTDDSAAEHYLGPERKDEIKNFVKAKQEFVRNNVRLCKVFPTFAETLARLLTEYEVWICTSAYKFFVDAVIKELPELKHFENKSVYRELYSKGKPDPDPLLHTAKKIELKPEECIYVGDTAADHKSATAAGMKFIYFNPPGIEWTSEIPKDVLSIKQHIELFKHT